LTFLRPRASSLAGLALLLAAAFPLAAGAAAGAPGESFSESIQVSVVTLDVFVTDKRGKPITGLRKEDFTVLEDGRPVEVSNFFAETGRSGAAVAAAKSPGAAAAADAPDQRLRLVVFVDDVSLSAANRSRILESVGTFLHTRLKPGDEVMLVRYDEKLDIRQPFTADLGRLDADLAALLVLPTDVRKYELSFAQAREELAQALNGGEGFGPLAEGALSSWAAQESSVVRGALDALDSVVSWLAGVPGRKAVLYVSDGLPLVPGQDLFTMFTRVPEAGGNGHTPEMVVQRFDLTRRFHQVTSHASRNRILFYPIEAYGTRGSLGGSLAAAGTLANRQNGLRLLAEDTGGRELLNATDVPGALVRMADDFSTYYSLGYLPQRPGDGLEHKTEVRVKPRGARVRYRQWYRDKPAGEVVAERTLAAMRFGAEENPLGATVEVVAGKEPGETLVRVHVPLARLYLEPQGDSRLGQLRLYMVVNGEGQTTSVRETRLANVTVPEAEAAAGTKRDYLHEIAIPLPKGSYALGLGVRDEKGTATSYLHRDFVVAGMAAQAAAKP
jgi:VWFA-related protein